MGKHKKKSNKKIVKNFQKAIKSNSIIMNELNNPDSKMLCIEFYRQILSK